MSIFNSTKTHCINGHPLTENNIKKLTNNSGHRVCKTCHRINAAKYRAARRKPKKTEAERFFKFVNKTDFCWIWLGSKAGGKNADYGVFSFAGKQGYAHRFSYQLHNGPIESGYQIDHLCRNRACVNPDHLESVTQKENLMRGETLTAINAKKTHCIRGHEYTPQNTYKTKNGRDCLECRRTYRERHPKKYLSIKNKI